MGQAVEHTTLRDDGNLLTLLLQLLGQLVGLRTLDGASGGAEIGDIGLQLGIERSIIVAIHQLLGADLTLRNGTEIDSLHRAILNDRLEIHLHLMLCGTGIPVEAHADGLRYRLRTHTRLTVTVVGVERQTHQHVLMTGLAVALEGVEHLNFVHLHIKEMPFGFIQTGDQGGIGHIAVNLLNNQAFGSGGLVLVGALRVALVLIVLLTFLVQGIALADISHDVVDRLVDTTLAGA